MIDWVKACAEEVFRELGPGHTESVYEFAMFLELDWVNQNDVVIMQQVPCPFKYKGFTVGVGYIDLLIDQRLIVELKSIAKLSQKDTQQVKKYLIALNLENGLLINFGSDLEIVEVRKDDHGETPSSTD